MKSFGTVQNRKTSSYDLKNLLDVIIIGHIAIDTNILPCGSVENALGGVPTYAGIALTTLKKKVGIVSKVGIDFKDFSFYSNQGIDIKGISIGGKRTTRFKNIYDSKGDRQQVCEGDISRITPEDIPKTYEEACSFYISPIIDEIGVDVIKRVKRKDNTVMLDPQGLFRKVDEKGRVEIALPKNLNELLRYVDIIKIGKGEVSAFKIGVKEILSCLVDAGPKIAIATLEREGCMLLAEDKVWKARSLKVDVKDPTGAGDVFGAIFLAIYMDTLNVREAIKFASVSAGLKIRYEGPTGFPSKGNIKEAKAYRF